MFGRKGPKGIGKTMDRRQKAVIALIFATIGVLAVLASLAAQAGHWSSEMVTGWIVILITLLFEFIGAYLYHRGSGTDPLSEMLDVDKDEWTVEGGM